MSDEVLAILTRLETGVAKLGAGQVKLEASVAKLETGVAKLEVGQANVEAGLTRTRSEIMDRIDRLQDKVTNQYDDLFVVANMHERTTRITKSIEETANTTADIVAVQARQISRLQADVRALKGEA